MADAGGAVDGGGGGGGEERRPENRSKRRQRSGSEDAGKGDHGEGEGAATPPASAWGPSAAAVFAPRSGLAAQLNGVVAAIDAAPEWPAIPLLLTLLAAATRYWRIHKPAAVVFDEHHFGRFTNQYWKGTYFFDIHPPLGKWGFLLTAWVAGYNADVCDYTNLGNEYDKECNFLPLRLTAAAFGTATVPLLYCAVRVMGLGRWGSILTSLLFIFDMLNLIESRLILTDSQLMFWITVCLLVGMLYFRRKLEHSAAEAVVLQAVELGVPPDAAQEALEYAVVVPGTTGVSFAGGADAVFDHGSDSMLGGVASYGAYPRKYLLSLWRGASKLNSPHAPSAAVAEATKVLTAAVGEEPAAPTLAVAPWPSTGEAPRLLTRWDNLGWCLALGLACGASVSVKWTGLGTPGLVALECWLGIFFLAEPVAFLDMLVMLGSAFAFYVTNYWFHFALLPRHGDGDAFMRIEFQRTLIGNENYDPEAPKPHFIVLFFQLAWEMLSGNARIDQRHNWESTWDQWILNQRGVLYHSNTTQPIRGRTESVYLIGNPAVIWLVAVLVAASIVYLFLHFRCRSVRMIARSYVFRGNGPTLALIAYCLVGYFCNLLPYLGVTRSCFCYHYMPALMYGEILAGVMVERLFGKRTGAAVAVQYITLAVVTVFIFFMPWIYSLPLSGEAHQQRRWLKGWD